MKLQKPKGTQDILPADSAKWQYVENVARETFISAFFINAGMFHVKHST